MYTQKQIWDVFVSIPYLADLHNDSAQLTFYPSSTNLFFRLKVTIAGITVLALWITAREAYR